MENYTFDLQRIFFGDLPLLFLLEIALRTLILYVYAATLIRLAPRTNIGQMNSLDLLVIIALGSSLGDPMFYPDVPIVHGMVVITIVIGLQALLVRLTQRSDTIEGLIEGDPIRVIIDGMLDVDGMKEAQLTREDVFAHLRLNEYEHLGQVQSAFIETNGQISMHAFPNGQQKKGFKIIPPVHRAGWTQYKTGEAVPESNDFACYTCGNIEHYEAGQTFHDCPRCQYPTWVNAVAQPDNPTSFS